MRVLSRRRLRRHLPPAPKQTPEGLRELLEHKDRSDSEMARFDELGPETRAAIRGSRFDAVPSRVRRRWGGPYSDDHLVAAAVCRDDEGYSGQFGPPAPKGI